MHMKNKLMPLTILVLLVGVVVYWKITHLITDQPVAPDTYIVWSVTRDTTDYSVDDTPGADALYSCDAFVYRYALGADKTMRLDRSTNKFVSCDYPYTFVSADQLIYKFSDYRLNLNGKKFAWEDPGKLGVEGVGAGELHVYSEYIMPEHQTIMTLVARNGESSQVFIDNNKHLGAPMYLSPIAVSDDGTQVYLGTFTEASYQSYAGIQLYTYDVATGTIAQVPYRRDLSFSEVKIDTASKRLLAVSGKLVPDVDENEAQHGFVVVGPSQLHLVDLVTGKGMELGVETTDEALLIAPRFSPVAEDAFSVESNGVTHLLSIDADGKTTIVNDLSGRVVEWSEYVLVLDFRSRYIIMDPSGMTELGTTDQADFSLANGGFGFQYLGSVTIE